MLMAFSQQASFPELHAPPNSNGIFLQTCTTMTPPPKKKISRRKTLLTKKKKKSMLTKKNKTCFFLGVCAFWRPLVHFSWPFFSPTTTSVVSEVPFPFGGATAGPWQNGQIRNGGYNGIIFVKNIINSSRFINVQYTRILVIIIDIIVIIGSIFVISSINIYQHILTYSSSSAAATLHTHLPCHPPTKTWKNPQKLYHHGHINKSTPQNSTNLHLSSLGLNRSCFALPFSTWHPSQTSQRLEPTGPP